MFPRVMKKEEAVSLLLRFSLGFVFLWFGIDKFVHPEIWAGWMPSWLVLPQTQFIYALGVVETVIGLCLVLRVAVSVAACAAAFLLACIIVSVPWSEISVRDIGLLGAVLALVFAKRDSFTIVRFFR